MHKQPVIMVQVDDQQWTQDVLHSACALARTQAGRIVLVQMVRVQHIAHLGTQFGNLGLEERQLHTLQECADTVADYGLDCELELFQYVDIYEATMEAAMQLGAKVVFARRPRSIIPFWAEARFEMLRQQLAHYHLELHDQPLHLVNGSERHIVGGRPAAASA